MSDHADLARAIEHHVAVLWPTALCRLHAPAVAGRLHSAFAAVGYDAVLLDERIEGGRGREWLENLMHRPEFAPVIYLAGSAEPDLAEQVMRRGAADCLLRERIDHRRFMNTLREILPRRRQQLALQSTASHAEERSHFDAVTILGHRHVRELASGGTAKVYLAESERAGEMVVLKVLRAGADIRQAHRQMPRFLREYELLSKVHHPNVVRIFDIGIADDHAFIAMEYFPRGDLRARMQRTLQPLDALRYLAQMAGALAVVHGVGVLHRDLKPGNIMLRVGGTLALIDFGLAKHAQMQVEMTGTGEIFGTPHYMSPEQGHGRQLDERSDLYSLGVIFYEMLMRQKPYVASTPMGVIYLHANAPLPRLESPLDIYQPLLDCLLAKDPADRFGSADDLVRAIHAMIR